MAGLSPGAAVGKVPARWQRAAQLFLAKADVGAVSRRRNSGVAAAEISGKSTFAKLVQRLYVPESGRVLAR
jgi:ABC-type oligopeptide transport system ATPase subunit